MLVSVFADASFCPDTRAAGWGGWAKSERGTTRSGGPLDRLDGSLAAEAWAVVRAVEMALHPGAAGAVAEPGDYLLIQTDCQAAIFALERDGALRSALIAVRGSCTVKFRWIRGHQHHSRAPRYAVNNYCDDEARRHMLEMRRQRT